jgi:hypothetical protein
MESTQGHGQKAEVWVGGELLCVCDGYTRRGERTPPGTLADARFVYISDEGFSWADAVASNRSGRKRLEHVKGWSYVGYGRVESIMPVAVDFGLLTMQDANWTTDESLIGKFVRIRIDRLEMVRAQQ